MYVLGAIWHCVCVCGGGGGGGGAAWEGGGGDAKYDMALGGILSTGEGYYCDCKPWLMTKVVTWWPPPLPRMLTPVISCHSKLQYVCAWERGVFSVSNTNQKIVPPTHFSRYCFAFNFSRIAVYKSSLALVVNLVILMPRSAISHLDQFRHMITFSFPRMATCKYLTDTCWAVYSSRLLVSLQVLPSSNKRRRHNGHTRYHSEQALAHVEATSCKIDVQPFNPSARRHYNTEEICIVCQSNRKHVFRILATLSLSLSLSLSLAMENNAESRSFS